MLQMIGIAQVIACLHKRQLQTTTIQSLHTWPDHGSLTEFVLFVTVLAHPHLWRYNADSAVDQLPLREDVRWVDMLGAYR